MPPALSDDEMSDAGNVSAVKTPTVSKRGKKASSYVASASDTDDDSDSGSRRSKSARANGSSKKKEVPVPIVEDEDNDEDEDEGDEEEEEYEVQGIVGHMLDDKKQPRFRVIWKGYPDASDHTWEPEENLVENASIILNDYYFRIGGRETIFEKATKGKKHGRPSASASASASATPTTSAAKRSKKAVKVDSHPASRESPPVDTHRLFKPPPGSWEDDVVDVEMFRGDDGELRVFLTWKNGNKSQHAAQQAYIRCPQKILRFYESRISFKSFADDS